MRVESNRWLAVLAFALTTLAVPSAAPQTRGNTPSAAVLMQQAQHEEIANGNCTAAIPIYERVVAAAGTNRALAAEALLRMAGCHERTGDARAKATYDRVINGFADQADAVRTARARLQALGAGARGLFEERIVDATTLQSAGLFRAVSADGNTVFASKVAGSQNRQEYSVVMRTIAGGAEQTITTTGTARPQEIRPSPDGRWLAVRMHRIIEQGPPRIFQVDVIVTEARAASKPATLTVIPRLNEAEAFGRIINAGWIDLKWSPNSRYLPYLQPGSAPGLYSVHLFSTVTRSSRPLNIESDGVSEFRWSPNGSELAVHVTNRATAQDEIVVIDIASDRRRTVAIPDASTKRTLLAEWTRQNHLVLRQFRSTAGRPVVRPEATDIVDVNLLPVSGGAARTICSSPTNRVGALAAFRFSVQSDTADECLSVTPDGATVVWWSRQSQRVMLRDTATLVDRALTTGSGMEQYPSLSPDGRMVLVNSNRSGRWAWHVALVGPAPDPDPVLLGHTSALADGLELYWSNGTVTAQWGEWSSELYRINVDPKTGLSTGPLERLTHDSGPAYTPAISPDSRRVAYWATVMGQLGLATMDANGANEMVIAPSMKPFGAPYWSRSDQVFFGERLRPQTSQIPDLWVDSKEPWRQWRLLNATSGAMSVLSMPDVERASRFELYRSIAFLQPTGELVYVVVNPVEARGGGFNPSTTKDVHTVRGRSVVDGRDRVLATIEAPNTTVMGLLASPDGRRLAYLLGYDKPTGRNDAELGVVTVGTSERRVLLKTTSPGEASINSPMAWSPDGRLLLYSRYAQPRVFDVDTLENWRLVQDAHQPEPNTDLATSLQRWGPTGEANWSPDGSFIVLTMSSEPRFSRQWRGVTAEALAKLRR